MRIYYYTGTGNSLWAARKLAERLWGAELISMKTARDPLIPQGCDRLGFVFPVHMFGLIGAVREFVRRLEADARHPHGQDEQPYVFAVAVNSGAVVRTLVQLNKALDRRGVSMQAGFAVILPSNYTPFGGPGTADQIESRIREAERKIGEIADYIEEGREGILEKGRLWQSLLLAGLNRLTLPLTSRMDRFFSVDESCNSCGTCVQVCPARNIELKDGLPEWRHRCEQCLACLQWCPEEAIQFGKGTSGRKRYHHPEITLEDILDGSAGPI
jgi:ferredoxin